MKNWQHLSQECIVISFMHKSHTSEKRPEKQIGGVSHWTERVQAASKSSHLNLKSSLDIQIG